MPEFHVVSEYSPAGDQPQAIEKLAEGVAAGLDEQTLLGVTGSGKTFTMAKVIERVQNADARARAQQDTCRAALHASSRDVLSGQRRGVFRIVLRLLPARGVHPAHGYLHRKGRLHRTRRSTGCAYRATSSLLERRDVIVVASVSCIYGLGEPDDFAAHG